MLTELTIDGYRSIRHVRLKMHPVTVVTGPNGTGKSNLYRALHLLSHAATGTLARAIAEEGGLDSVMWAGPNKHRDPPKIKLAVEMEDWSYSVAFGYVAFAESVFPKDPGIKEEYVHHITGRRPLPFLERSAEGTNIRGREHVLEPYSGELIYSQTALAEIRDPHQYPELLVIRERIDNWRFYHHFRTDADSPMRRPQVVTQTRMLSHDGRDLAAALLTIKELEDPRNSRYLGFKPLPLNDIVKEAFPGCSLEFFEEKSGAFIGLKRKGLNRPLTAPELSDGTLRYLCLLAALCTPQPPELIALNEPETSLHPDLLRPLARLIQRAATRTQVWVTTHSRELAEYLQEETDTPPYQLELRNEETKVIGQGLLDF